MLPIQIQILAVWMTARDRRARDDRPRPRGRAGELTGNVIFLAALAVAAAAVGGDRHRPAQLQRRQGPRLTARRGRGDRGVVATVIVLPALLLSFWLVLQYALVQHARHVAQAAAQDAAIAAASGAGDPGAVAGGVIDGSAGSITSNVSVAAGGDRRGHGHRLRRRAAGVPDRLVLRRRRRPRRRSSGSSPSRSGREPPASAAASGATPARWRWSSCCPRCCCCSGWWWRSAARRRPTPTSSTPLGSAPGRRPSAQTDGRGAARGRASSSPRASADAGLACASGPSVAVGGSWEPGGRVTVTVSCAASLGDVTQFGSSRARGR